MRVAHVVVSVSRKSGGLFHSVAGMAKAEAELPGMDVQVHGVEDEFSAADAPSWQPLVPQIHPAAGPAFLGWAPGMKKGVMQGDYDVVHNHGLWQHVSRVGMSWQRCSKKPHIVSPRGMLDPWALANSGWKKRLAAAAFENRHLREAACLHALCEAEAEAMRGYGLRNPIAVVPNGVALPAQRRDERALRPGVSVGQSFGKGAKTLLFLGRLHPKKGLPEALRAWAEVTRGAETGWRFVIAGWDQGGHEAELKRMCRELGLPQASVPSEELTAGSWQLAEGQQVAGGGWRVKGNDRRSDVGGQPKRSEDRLQSDQRSEGQVIFAGPAFGEAKDVLLRSADAFILPSLSEGLPMSVLEAWAYGLPVVMTDECNLPEGFAAQAAIRIGAAAPSDESGGGSVSVFALGDASRCLADSARNTGVAVALRELMGMTDAEREVMGVRGRKLVEERFTWPKVAAQMKQVYDWVVGNRARPDFVRVTES